MSSGMSLLQEFQRHRQQQLKKQKQKVLPVTSSIESTSSLSPNNETKVATVPPRSTEPIVTTRNSNDSCNKSNDGLPSPLSDDILVRDSSLKNHHYGSGTSITSSSQKDEQQMAEDSTPPQDDDDDDVLITVCTGINCGALKQEKGKRRQQHYKDQVGDNIGNSTTTIATTRTKHNPGSTTATACGGTACHGEGVGIGGSGTGTSAALIEIEELITEYHFQKEQCMQKNDNHKNNENGCHYDDHDDSSSVQPQHTPYLRVTSAGCTHHCTVGPNVFVRRMHNTTTKRLTNKVTRFVGKEQKQQEKELQHFTRVDSVAQCNHVMACATQAYKDANNKENAGSAYEKSDNSLLQIRADGIRWKALRELVRTEAAPTQEEGQQTRFHNQYKESTRDMLQKAYDAEIMAAGKNVKKQERARRRSKRLFTRLNYHTTNDPTPMLT